VKEEEIMKVSSHFVGIQFKPYQTTISQRGTMNYAAALNDNNPAYFDDTQDRPLVGHPLQVAAVTWPIVERIQEYIDTDDFPREIMATQVHYDEHIQLHRLINPGDNLNISGQIAAILPHPIGTHIINRFDARDKNDKPVFTEFIGGLMRGVQCPDGGRGKENLPPVSKIPGTNTPVSWESTVDIDPLQAFIYDGCSNIHFPIHTSIRFARKVGLPTPIFQGSATLALAVTELVTREANADPTRIKSIACRFSDMVIPGSQIVVQLLMESPAEGGGRNLFFQVLNAQGKKAISNGHLVISA